jgi:hypothetical protein
MPTQHPRDVGAISDQARDDVSASGGQMYSRVLPKAGHEEPLRPASSPSSAAFMENDTTSVLSGP